MDILLLRDRAVDVVLLRRMDAHQGFEGYDEPLGVVYEVTIDLLGFQVRRSPAEQAGDMLNFAVRPAHRR